MSGPTRWKQFTLAVAVLAAFSGRSVHSAQTRVSSLVDLSIEQLSDIVVTSVSRREEPLSDAAASVYVITAEDIRRSTATTLPEALRLAPNLLVSRLDSGQYAISARGFNSNVANKLLVLLDGRTIYSPMFSNVFWELHDVMIEDVDRIEVISGAGGTTWGSNAVNGVINVVSKSTKATQGALDRVPTGRMRQPLRCGMGDSSPITPRLAPTLSNGERRTSFVSGATGPKTTSPGSKGASERITSEARTRSPSRATPSPAAQDFDRGRTGAAPMYQG